MPVNAVVSGLGVAAGFLAAFFWFWASLLPVPDNIDIFIDALQWASRLNTYAASAMAVAALCATFQFARQIEL